MLPASTQIYVFGHFNYIFSGHHLWTEDRTLCSFPDNSIKSLERALALTPQIRGRVEAEGRLHPTWPPVGWSAVGWWDRQGDARCGSHTVVAAPGTWTDAELIEAAHARVPWAFRVVVHASPDEFLEKQRRLNEDKRHLLSIAQLYALAPRALGAVFGPESDTEPRWPWRGPASLALTPNAFPERADRQYPVFVYSITGTTAWILGHEYGDQTTVPLDRLFLDLRTGAGARIAKLCVRALDFRCDAAYIVAADGVITLRWTFGVDGGGRRDWNQALGTELSSTPIGFQLLPGCSAAEALVALTLHLADKIAGLSPRNRGDSTWRVTFPKPRLFKAR